MKLIGSQLEKSKKKAKEGREKGEEGLGEEGRVIQQKFNGADVANQVISVSFDKNLDRWFFLNIEWITVQIFGPMYFRRDFSFALLI